MAQILLLCYAAGRKRQDSKECWVAVSTKAFGEELASRGVKDPQEAVSDLKKEFENILKAFSIGKPVPSIISAKAQKWGSGFKGNLLHEMSLLDRENGLAACGDFCAESSAEGALLSGHHLARQILDVECWLLQAALTIAAASPDNGKLNVLSVSSEPEIAQRGNTSQWMTRRWKLTQRVMSENEL